MAYLAANLSQLHGFALVGAIVTNSSLQDLAALRGLTHLELNDCGVGPLEAAVLAKVLKVGSLVTLDLSNNRIGAEGAAVLAEALKVPNEPLGTLNLAHNKIGPDGAAALAEALKVPGGSLGTLKT
jgi:Ran GTPase-activating protein (RanGAP) involved in mRNA processing and transport